MVNSVATTVFHHHDPTCYQCGQELECPTCRRLEENSWKLSARELRLLREELARAMATTGLPEPGAGVCPGCGLPVGCQECRLQGPISAEQLERLATARVRSRRSRRSAA